MFKFRRLVAALCTAAATVVAAPVAGLAHAADVAEPEYQIKLLVSPDAIDEDGTPSEAFRSMFTVIGQTDVEQARYFDTADGFYAKHGWSIRVRHTEGKDSLDTTFKYRSPLADNSLSKASVNAGLKDARDNNFDSFDTNYKAQVNAGFAHRRLTLAIRRQRTALTRPVPFPSVRLPISSYPSLNPAK